jgi:hypothetical protein
MGASGGGYPSTTCTHSPLSGYHTNSVRSEQRAFSFFTNRRAWSFWSCLNFNGFTLDIYGSIARLMLGGRSTGAMMKAGSSLRGIVGVYLPSSECHCGEMLITGV